MEYRPPLSNNQVNQQLYSQQFNPIFFPQYVLNPTHTSFSQPMLEQSQFSPHQSSQKTNQQPPAVQKKNRGQGKERNPNWSKGEDEALCKAWLRVSKDPITGTDQSRGRLWDRIRDEFNNILGYNSERISTHLMNRWCIIQSHINKYSGFVRTIERAPASGFNVEDSIGAAKQLYYKSQGHHFKWDGCWLLLKDSVKWLNYTQEQEGIKQKMAQKKRREGFDDKISDLSNQPTPTIPGSGAGSITLDNEISILTDGSHELKRPPGRKVTKNTRRKGNNEQLEDLNLIVAEFSHLRKEQKEISEQEITMANERERMKIQAKQEHEQRRIEAKLEQERMKIAAKREQEKMRLEKEIMMTDLNKIPTEERKAWVIAKQKAIWARTIQGGNGDDLGNCEV